MWRNNFYYKMLYKCLKISNMKDLYIRRNLIHFGECTEIIDYTFAMPHLFRIGHPKLRKQYLNLIADHYAKDLAILIGRIIPSLSNEHKKVIECLNNMDKPFREKFINAMEKSQLYCWLSDIFQYPIYSSFIFHVQPYDIFYNKN